MHDANRSINQRNRGGAHMGLRWGGWELGVKRVKGSERDWKAETILMEREGVGGLYLLGGRVFPERWRWRRPKSEKTMAISLIIRDH